MFTSSREISTKSCTLPSKTCTKFSKDYRESDNKRAIVFMSLKNKGRKERKALHF